MAEKKEAEHREGGQLRLEGGEQVAGDADLLREVGEVGGVIAELKPLFVIYHYEDKLSALRK